MLNETERAELCKWVKELPPPKPYMEDTEDLMSGLIVVLVVTTIMFYFLGQLPTPPMDFPWWPPPTCH